MGGGPLRPPSSFALVVQVARRRRSGDARNRTQIFVDGPEVMLSHVVVDRPWHYLEKFAIKGRWKAVCGYSGGTGWMDVIHVNACPDDLNKLSKGVASFRPPSFVWRQVP